MTRWSVAILFIILGIFFTDYLVTKDTFFYFGKDDGLLFRVFSLSIFNSLSYSTLKGFSVKSLISGFIMGICGYLIVFLSYSIYGFINHYKYNTNMILTMKGDYIVASTIAFILVVFQMVLLGRSKR